MKKIAGFLFFVAVTACSGKPSVNSVKSGFPASQSEPASKGDPNSNPKNEEQVASTIEKPGTGNNGTQPPDGEKQPEQQPSNVQKSREFPGVYYSEHVSDQKIQEMMVGATPLDVGSAYVMKPWSSDTPTLFGTKCFGSVKKELHFYTPNGIKKVNTGSSIEIVPYLDDSYYSSAGLVDVSGVTFRVPIDPDRVQVDCTSAVVTVGAIELFVDRALTMLSCRLDPGALLTQYSLNGSTNVSSFEGWTSGNPARKCAGFARSNAIITERKSLAVYQSVSVGAPNISTSPYTSLFDFYYSSYCSGEATSDFSWNYFDVERFPIKLGTKFLITFLGTDPRNASAEAILGGSVIQSRYSDLPAGSFTTKNCNPEMYNIVLKTPKLFVEKYAVEVVNGSATVKKCNLPQGDGFVQKKLGRTIRYSAAGSFVRNYDLVKFEGWVSTLCGFGEGILIVN